MAETRTYEGGCHCGRVQYRVETDLAMVAQCNCSICEKRGALWTFVKAPQFTLLKGEDALTDYQFNKHVIHHLFCNTCGIKSFARGKSKDGGDTVAINTRCLDGVDAGKLNVVQYDGRSK